MHQELFYKLARRITTHLRLTKSIRVETDIACCVSESQAEETDWRFDSISHFD